MCAHIDNDCLNSCVSLSEAGDGNPKQSRSVADAVIGSVKSAVSVCSAEQ